MVQTAVSFHTQTTSRKDEAASIEGSSMTEEKTPKSITDAVGNNQPKATTSKWNLKLKNWKISIHMILLDFLIF